VASTDGLAFPSGSTWELAFWDLGAAKRAISGIRHDPSVAVGMSVREIREVAEPTFSDEQRFRMASPFIARTRNAEKHTYLSWKDPEADEALTRTLHTKLRAAGLDDHIPHSRIEVQHNDPRARAKLVRIRDIAHKASFCHITVHGGPDCSRFVWLTGVGALTGCGMGMVQ
jgi:CRISPR-associated endoribonuclease Cas6